MSASSDPTRERDRPDRDGSVAVPNPLYRRVAMVTGREKTTVEWSPNRSFGHGYMTHETEDAARAYIATQDDPPRYYLIPESFL